MDRREGEAQPPTVSYPDGLCHSVCHPVLCLPSLCPWLLCHPPSKSAACLPPRRLWGTRLLGVQGPTVIRVPLSPQPPQDSYIPQIPL